MKPRPRHATRVDHSRRTARLNEGGQNDRAVDPPDRIEPSEEPDDASELDDFGPAPTDDARWDVFIPDDDERDPLPDPDDFWNEFLDC